MPPRYVNGFVSRFAAGPRAVHPQVITLLQQSGIATQSMEQLLDATLVSNVADRQRLAALVSALLDLPLETTGGTVLSAGRAHSQPARGASHSIDALANAGLSLTAAHQFIAGQPIANEYDRQVLSGIVSWQLSRLYGADGAYVLTRVSHSA
jgi:hypothetical protein